MNTNEKKTIIFIISFAAILTAVVLIAFGMYMKKDNISNTESVTLYQTTASNSTEAHSEGDDLFTLSQDSVTLDSLQEGDTAIVTESITHIANKSKDELVKEYVDAINKLKKTDTFKLNKSSSMNIQVNEITGGSIAEKILQSFIDDANNSVAYSFKNGVDSVTGETPNGVLPPADANSSLTVSDVKSAELVSSSQSGYTVKLVLNDEHITGSDLPEAHLNCLPELNMDMSESNLTIENYDVLFSGSTVVAKYDNQGRLTYVEHIARSPGMTCDGKAVISLHVLMSGNLTTIYNISY